MAVNLSIKLNNKIAENVLTKALQDMLRQKLKDTVKQNRRRVIDIFYKHLTNSSTFNNLHDNWGLQGDLGVQTYYVEEAAKSIARMINLETIPPQTKKLGGIKVTLVREDLSPILQSAFAQYETDKGVTIPWLEWLLTKGSEILVANYTVAAEENPGEFSRTGALIMFPQKGSSFSINSHDAGTVNDNWITRSANAALPEIQDILMRGMQHG